jgi:sigma-B regulation protein RsbU (phosphoserine phosphatase)
LNINHMLMQLGELDGFVSIFYAVVSRSTRQMTYTRAGHERPLLLRDGKVTALSGDGAVLGILDGEDLRLSEEHIDLSSGDRLVLYTDGLTDVADPSGQFLGFSRLEALVQKLARLPAEEICTSLFDALGIHRGGADQFDDMTVMVLEVS